MAVKSTVGDIWPYGPMSAWKAGEKRKQEEAETNRKYREAMAEYYRQGGSRPQGGISSPQATVLNALGRALSTGEINIQQYNQAYRELTGKASDLMTPEAPQPYTRIQSGTLPSPSMPHKEGELWANAPMTTSGFGTNGGSALAGITGRPSISRTTPAIPVTKPVAPAAGMGGFSPDIGMFGTKKPTQTGMPQISTDEEYDRLPSGAEFIDAQTGIKYRKP